MSTAAITTASSNASAVFEDGKRVYPCRCGQVHRGDYAAYDHAHHNCFHESGLTWISGPADSDDDQQWSLMCVECGKTFGIAAPQSLAQRQ